VRILDRQCYWSFIKAYVICYVSLVGLFIVIDAFANYDEFAKRADGVVEMCRVMGRYYLVHQSLFFDYLCGVIGMMAAVFTVTWMQRNNEQLAMLSAGISTHRAILPVLFASVIVSFFAIGNQEVIMPRYAEELSRTHDDDGQRSVHVTGRYDANVVLIHGLDADRATKTLYPFYATIPVGIFGSMREIKAEQATYIPPDDPKSPLKGGWLVRKALVSPPLEDDVFLASSEVLHHVYVTTGFPPALVLPTKGDQPGQAAAKGATQGAGAQPTAEAAQPIVPTPHSETGYLAASPILPVSVSPFILQVHILLDRKFDVNSGTFFLKSSLNFQAMTRRPDWYKFATTIDLIEGLTDPSTEEGSERDAVSMFVHGRILRPFLGFTLLCMSLPLVLGGYGRNMFINLGLALGNSAIFYGALIFCQYLGNFEVLSPVGTAWAPFFVFGTIATLRWDQIRT
jgi:lipopolysaccharide export LptBFGC system permease protein LptF